MEGLSGVMVKPTIDEAIKNIQDRFVTPEALTETVQRLQGVEERVTKVEEQAARTMQEITRVTELEERMNRLERQLAEAQSHTRRMIRNGIIIVVALAVGEIIIWYLTRPIVIP
jgi:prefoldin subunit 5